MDRKTFLEKARQIACEQVVSSSALTDSDFADIQYEIQNEAMNEEEALSQKAKVILEDAALDIED
jgi:hypothetical protein